MAKSNRETREEKRHGIGGNMPPKPLATPSQCGAALEAEVTASAKSKTATADRYRLFLMLTTSDLELAERMSASYKQSLAPAGQTAETRQRVRAAKNVLFRMFGAPEIPEENDKGEDAAKKSRRELIQRNALESIRLCDAIHTGGYSKSIDFHKEGGTYIKYDSPLGQHLWSINKWNDDETFKKRRSEMGEKDVQLVESAWYTVPARAILWNDLTTAVAGAKRTGQAPKPTRAAVSTSDVGNGLQTVANFYETNAPKATEIPVIRGTLENVRRIVDNTVKGIPTVSDKLAAFLAAADALIACFADPNKTVKVEKPTDNVTELNTAKAK